MLFFASRFCEFDFEIWMLLFCFSNSFSYMLKRVKILYLSEIRDEARGV